MEDFLHNYPHARARSSLEEGKIDFKQKEHFFEMKTRVSQSLNGKEVYHAYFGIQTKTEMSLSSVGQYVPCTLSLRCLIYAQTRIDRMGRTVLYYSVIKLSL